jgi:hypothetical protein
MGERRKASEKAAASARLRASSIPFTWCRVPLVSQSLAAASNLACLDDWYLPPSGGGELLSRSARPIGESRRAVRAKL